MVFFGYFATILASFYWFTASSDGKVLLAPIILIFFHVSTVLFFMVGTYAIVDVHLTMEKEYEQVKKKQEEVERNRRELETMKKLEETRRKASINLINAEKLKRNAENLKQNQKN